MQKLWAYLAKSRLRLKSAIAYARGASHIYTHIMMLIHLLTWLNQDSKPASPICSESLPYIHTHELIHLTWLNLDSKPPSPMLGEPPKPQCAHPTKHGFLKFTNVQLIKDMPPPGPTFIGSMTPTSMGPPTSERPSN